MDCRFNNSTSLLASCSSDRSILIWDCKNSFENISVLKNHTNAILCLAWTFNDELISGSADKSVCCWDLETSKVIRKSRGHTFVVNAVACPKRTQNIYASVGDDGCLLLWESRVKKEIGCYAHKYPLTSVSFNLNGDLVFAGGIDNNILCYDIRAKNISYAIEGHQDTVCSLSLAHDGNFLMSNSFDETVRVWDIRSTAAQSKRLVKTMSGHKQGSEKSLIRGCWSRDCLYVGCGSIDKCVYIWDTSTKRIVQKLGGHTGTVNSTDMGDTNLVASASNDKTIIVSRLPDVML